MTDFLTQAQIAALENRCERTVARWRAVDRDFPQPVDLPCGGRVLFRRADYEAWRARREEIENTNLAGRRSQRSAP
ncbi:MAG: helix-turn-helix transcriptional regulator [Terricaulis sp.]